MHKSLWLQVIAGIQPGPNSLAQFQSNSGISSADLARRVLRQLATNGVGTQQQVQGVNGQSVSYSFSNADRLSASMMAIQGGCDLEHVSALLTWKDFEGLASRALVSSGYRTSTNVRFKKPRMEIDVVGSLNGLAIAVDCKHWKRRNLSAIRLHCEKQAARCLRLFDNTGSQVSASNLINSRIFKVLPVILTLYPQGCKFVDGVPVVPISQFRSFVLDIDSLVSDVRFVTAV